MQRRRTLKNTAVAVTSALALGGIAAAVAPAPQAEAQAFRFIVSPHSERGTIAFSRFNGGGSSDIVHRGERSSVAAASFWLPGHCKAYATDQPFHWKSEKYGRYVNLYAPMFRLTLAIDC